MAIPFALGKVIDIIYSVNQETMVQNLTNVSLGLVGVFIIGAVCNFGRTYLMGISGINLRNCLKFIKFSLFWVVGQKITQTLRSKVYSAIVKQEVAFFDKNKTGELINRLSADTSLVSQCVTSNIADGIRSTTLVIAGVSMMVKASNWFQSLKYFY